MPGSLLGGLCADRDNFSHSSTVAATFCVVFTTTLHGGTPTSMRIRKLPNIVFSVSCKGSPLQYPAHSLRGLSFPFSSFWRSSVEHQLGLVVPSLEAQNRSRVFTPLPLCARKRSSLPFAVDKSLHCSGCWLLFHERDCDTSTFVLNLWRTLRLRCHRRHRWNPKVIPIDAEEMGEGVVGRLITSSIRLPMGHSSTIFFCAEYLGTSSNRRRTQASHLKIF